MAASDTIVVIPARIGSTRLKEKPLRTIDGIPLITHVCRRALEADVGPVILCSDDEMVLWAAPKGIRTLMGQNIPQERCGSDRVAWVIESRAHPVALKAWPYIVNLQGDLPFIDPQIIRGVALERSLVSKADIVTAGHYHETVRADHDWVPERPTERHTSFARYRGTTHIGIYAFTSASLMRFASLPPSKGELEDRLEQQRAVENGMTIDMIPVDHMPLEINTEADLKHANLIAQCIWRDADAGVSN